jgi:hypothetical protein
MTTNVFYLKPKVLKLDEYVKIPDKFVIVVIL